MSQFKKPDVFQDQRKEGSLRTYPKDRARSSRRPVLFGYSDGPLDDVQQADSTREQEMEPMSVPISHQQLNPGRSQHIATAEQETPLPLPVASALSFFYSRSPRPLRSLLLVVLDRVRDQQPEEHIATDQNASARWLETWGWLLVLTFVSACGIALIAYGFSNSRDGGPYLRIFCYSGLSLIFAPTAWRLITPSTARVERIILLCIVGMDCYCIKIMASPLYFSLFDEFFHWRTAQDIASSGHLFTPNALLPVSPYYPGLEIVTNALSTLSGLDIFHAGLVVIGAARLLLILGLFALNERVVQSARVASIATLLYMVNSNFIFFNAQFAYESLAIPLTVFMLFVMTPYQSLSARLTSLRIVFPSMMFLSDHKRLRDELSGVMMVGCITLVAVVITHHMTDFFLDGLLVSWIMMFGLLRITRSKRLRLVCIVLIGLVLSLVWMSLSGNPVISYLTSYFATSLGSPRQLFHSVGGSAPPLWWERVLAIIYVLSNVICIPIGLLCIWKRYRTNALICTLGITSLFYIVSQFFRFTNSGIEVQSRSSSLVFIGVAPVLALFITHFWPTRRLNGWNSALIAGALLVLFLGGFALEGGGVGLNSLPGSYLMAADARSIEPEGMQAALWARSYLGSNNLVGANLTDQALMGTYGNQNVVNTAEGHVGLSAVFFSLKLDKNQLTIIKESHVHYLVIDQRMSQYLPEIGYYFTKQEADAYNHTSPVPQQALTKFSAVPQINRVLDGGDIVIYDVGGLTNA